MNNVFGSLKKNDVLLYLREEQAFGSLVKLLFSRIIPVRSTLPANQVAMHMQRAFSVAPR